YFRGDSIAKNLVYGVGVNAPFGVHTEYDKDSFARYEGTETSLKTLNINPALAMRLSEQFDIGAGLNVQVGQAILSRSLDSYLVCQRFVGLGAAPAGTCGALGLNSASNVATDGQVTIEADGIGYGFNLGAAYRPDSNTTLSLGLRSPVKYELEGDADFKHSANLLGLGEANLAAAGLGDQNMTADLKMPASASLSAARRINDRLTVYGDVTWTEWSSVPEIRIQFPDTVADDSVTDLQWEDTVRVGAGLTYQLNEKTRLRAGIAQDPTPTPSPKNRTLRAPSSDNLWLSAGVSHAINRHFTIDAGFSFVRPSDASINYTAPGSTDYTTRADTDSDVMVGAISVNYRF
ncbi:MAG: outer membrane protein transport protein, partial [Thiolinea sp.]